MGLRAKTTTAAINSGGGSSKHANSNNNCKFLNGGKKLNKNLLQQQNSTTSMDKKLSPTSPTSNKLLAKVLQPPCLNCKTAVSETTCCQITSIRTTYRSNSTSALIPSCTAAGNTALPSSSSNCMRPQTLNVHNYHDTPADHTQLFLGYVFLNFIILFFVLFYVFFMIYLI